MFVCISLFKIHMWLVYLGRLVLLLDKLFVVGTYIVLDKLFVVGTFTVYLRRENM